jgi:hypothetical protein
MKCQLCGIYIVRSDLVGQTPMCRLCNTRIARELADYEISNLTDKEKALNKVATC